MATPPHLLPEVVGSLGAAATHFTASDATLMPHRRKAVSLRLFKLRFFFPPHNIQPESEERRRGDGAASISPDCCILIKSLHIMLLPSYFSSADCFILLQTPVLWRKTASCLNCITAEQRILPRRTDAETLQLLETPENPNYPPQITTTFPHPLQQPDVISVCVCVCVKVGRWSLAGH